MQPVTTLGERLALDQYVVGELDDRVLICPGAPYLPIGNKPTPHLSPIDKRPVIGHGDIGDADALGYAGKLAGLGQVKRLRLCEACEKKTCRKHGEEHGKCAFHKGASARGLELR